jgi:hypothetical protein
VLNRGRSTLRPLPRRQPCSVRTSAIRLRSRMRWAISHTYDKTVGRDRGSRRGMGVGLLGDKAHSRVLDTSKLRRLGARLRRNDPVS